MLKEKIISLHKSGKSYNEISEILSCSKGTISYHLSKNGKQNQRNRMRRHRLSIREKAISILGGKCVECGESRIRTLHIDHIEPVRRKDNTEHKAHAVALSVTKGVKDNLQILCANCHAIKTYNERDLM